MAANQAFFGDNDRNRVFAIDLDRWTSVEITTGDGPYPVDKISPEHVLASTRKAKEITRIEIAAPHRALRVPLTHVPRSATAHPGKKPLVLVSGADQVRTTVLDVSQDPREVQVVGSGNMDPVTDFGGRLRTGHPYWLDAASDRFMELDRVTRIINIYELGRNSPIASLQTPSSVHEVTRIPGEAGRWYAVCEGRRGAVAPSLFVIDEDDGEFKAAANLELPVPLSGYDRMGGHHVDLHPDGCSFYFGSAEGNVYVVEPAKRQVRLLFETGAGHGHTRIAAARGLAISTNHDDSFVTVWETATNRKLCDIEVSKVPATDDKKRQAHTSAISPDGKFYYSCASTDGLFYAIDLDKLELAKCMELGGYPIQGTFAWAN